MNMIAQGMDLRPAANGGFRRGDWMQTYSGFQFWPLDPVVEEIDIVDIAHALAHQCRYAGHSNRFYSVAEHCVLASRAMPDPELKLVTLMHDASEAYLVDVPRPVKPFLRGYVEAEAQLEKIIALKYGLSWPWPALVKDYDTAMLFTERDQLFTTPPAPWTIKTPITLDVKLYCWAPEIAKSMFLREFNYLTTGL